MINDRIDSRGSLPCAQFRNALRRVSLAVLFSLVLSRSAPADVVKLKNGELIKCKVVKEMDGLIKVRMPRRGKIVTTFLRRGLVESINKSSEADNRKLFQGGGVHNPGRNYEPVYYSGVAPAPGAAAAPGGGKQAAVKAKAKGRTTARKRGVEARRERSEARTKAWESRFGGRASRGSTAEAAAAPSSPAAPATSASSSTTVRSSSGL